MALADIRMSILTFPQGWDAGVLEARVLLLPMGDPQAELGADLPAFAGTAWPLRVTVVPSSEALPGATPGPASGAMSFTFTATPPEGALDLFQALAVQLMPVAPAARKARLDRLAATQIRKQLPDSYVKAFPFERPAPGTTLTDEFGCALRDTTPARETDEPPANIITWGAILSFALRQPALARALGLIHEIPFPDGVPGPLVDGGWIYVELDPAGAIQPSPAAAVRRYAARLPVLQAGVDRPVFAAVVFLVGVPMAAPYDQPLAEAARYADGFARIVHSSQAVTADAASGGHNHLRPATDAGIELGWDDEQVTTWFNRQLKVLQAHLGGAPADAEAPLGVSGYRIDVSLHEDPEPPVWQPLCRAISVDAKGAPAPLRFPPPPDDPVFSHAFDGELTVEPVPVRGRHATDQTAWLPRYFTRWQGGSLVANDPTLFRLSGTSPRAGAGPDGPPLVVPPPTYAGAPPLVPLRYGTQYHFRCRLADLTGGGPRPDREQVGPALSPVATTRFRRHVQPKTVRLETNIAPPAPGEETPDVGTVTAIRVWRPLIGYPELVFAGITDPAVIAALLADAGAARNEQRAVGANDPDVTHLLVSVRVRAAAHDPDPSIDTDGFRPLYAVKIAFPSFDAGDVIDRGDPITLTLRYQDAGNIAEFEDPPDDTTELPIPRARDVRLHLTPLCDEKPNYFGAPWVQEGLTAHVSTRAASEQEARFYVEAGAGDELNGILLRSGPDLMQRLADQLDLAANGLTLAARPGERVVFGASGALRHTLSGDRGAITFASESELVGRWLGVIRMRIQRDWTWDGLEDEGFVVSRRDEPGAPDEPVVVGQLQVPFAVSSQAVAAGGTPGSDPRAVTTLVFFDAVDPNPPAGQFPKILHPEWTIEPRIRGFGPAGNAALKEVRGVRLPIAARPRQTPRLVSAGIALSPYDPAADYSSTNPRRRSLWIELEEPVADDRDALFARVLSYGPDPLLSGAITHQLRPVPPAPVGPTTLFDLVEQALPHPPPFPPLAVDPEPIRVILPGQPEDGSGRDAMDPPLVAGAPPPGEAKPRHYLLPLPPGIDPDAPELFGFWTYELRIGHLDWSTEQDCFGRPLLVKGVQHPAPTLRCSAFRVTPPKPAIPRIVVTAPFATAVFEDQKLTRFEEGDPRTRLWALLYARVTQADGKAVRNVLVARGPATPRLEMTALGMIRPVGTRDLVGVAEFDPVDVERTLAMLALPPDTPLSAIVVELLPGDGLVQTETTVATTDLLFTEIEWKGYVLTDVPEGTSVPGLFRTAGEAPDPLGRELGAKTSRRILRCSPLTPIAPAC